MTGLCIASLIAWLIASAFIYRLATQGLKSSTTKFFTSPTEVMDGLSSGRSRAQKLGTAYMLWAQVWKSGKWTLAIAAIVTIGTAALGGVCNNNSLQMFRDCCNTLLQLCGKPPLPPPQ